MALIPHVTRLRSSIIRILGCNPGPMTLQGTNTYLLGTGKSRILIDTGDVNVPKYIDNLKNVLKEENAKIKTIILTHWHHDHVGGVKDIIGSKFANEVSLTNADCQVFKYRRPDAEIDKCPEIPLEIQVHELHDQQEFEVDNVKLRVVHTPGHTTDHVIVTTDDGVLFSGDCILGEGTAIFEDLHDYMQSLNKILNIAPQIIYPGHGNIIEAPIDKIQYYIAHRNKREQQILEVFKQHPNKLLEAMDVVKIIYKETPEQLWPAAAKNVTHHMQKLIKEQKLQRINENEHIYYRYPISSAL